MKVSMKDLHLSCSEDRGPLNNINILSFQDNKEDLVRSFHSLPNPPYIVFTRKILNNKQPWPTPLTGLLPNPGTQSPPEILYESDKNAIDTPLTIYLASCRGRTDALEIRDPNPPNTTNTQIKIIKNANTNSSHQKSILQLIPARNLLPSLLPRLQLVKLKFSVEDRRSAFIRKQISLQEKTL